MVQATLVLTAAMASSSACGGKRGCPVDLPARPEATLLGKRSQLLAAGPLDGEASVEMRQAARRIKARALFIAEPPDRARIDIMTQFGPVLSFVTDGTRIQILDLQNNAFIEGPACATNIARFLGLPLANRDLPLLLAGALPLLETEGTRSISCDGGRVHLELAGRRKQASYAFEQVAGAWEATSARFETPQQRLWSAQLSDFQRHELPGKAGGKVSLPRLIEAEAPEPGGKLRVKLRERRFGRKAKPEAFTLRTRAGVKRYFAPCTPTPLVEIGQGS